LPAEKIAGEDRGGVEQCLSEPDGQRRAAEESDEGGIAGGAIGVDGLLETGVEEGKGATVEEILAEREIFALIGKAIDGCGAGGLEKCPGQANGQGDDEKHGEAAGVIVAGHKDKITMPMLGRLSKDGGVWTAFREVNWGIASLATGPPSFLSRRIKPNYFLDYPQIHVILHLLSQFLQEAGT
jgi:hypothetical protein